MGSNTSTEEEAADFVGRCKQATRTLKLDDQKTRDAVMASFHREAGELHKRGDQSSMVPMAYIQLRYEYNRVSPLPCSY
jgi:hypothetical protein